MTTPFADNKKLGVINFLGGPGVGKSTLAPKIHSIMRENGYKCELVPEFAKSLVWDKRYDMFTEQDYITAHQNRYLRQLIGHDVDYAVCDTSLFLANLYMPWDFPPSFRMYLRELYDTYDNINILCLRNPNFIYDQVGRNQDYEGALQKDRELQDYLNQQGIHYTEVLIGTNQTANQVMDIVRAHRDQKNFVAN